MYTHEFVGIFIMVNVCSPPVATYCCYNHLKGKTLNKIYSPIGLLAGMAIHWWCCDISFQTSLRLVSLTTHPPCLLCSPKGLICNGWLAVLKDSANCTAGVHLVHSPTSPFSNLPSNPPPSINTYMQAWCQFSNLCSPLLFPWKTRRRLFNVPTETASSM